MSDVVTPEFILLVENDNEIVDLQQRLERIDKDNNKIDQEISALKKKIELSTNELNDIKKMVDNTTLDLKTLEAEEIQKKRKFANASSPKEYYSLEQELKAIADEKSLLDERLMNLWQELEVKKNQNSKNLNNFENEIQKLESQKQTNQELLQRTNLLLADLIKRSDSYCKGIDPELLKKYYDMKARSVKPVVAAKNGHCPICFYAIPSSSQQLLKQHKLVQCKDCYRLLYLKEDATS